MPGTVPYVSPPSNLDGFPAQRTTSRWYPGEFLIVTEDEVFKLQGILHAALRSKHFSHPWSVNLMASALRRVGRGQCLSWAPTRRLCSSGYYRECNNIPRSVQGMEKNPTTVASQALVLPPKNLRKFSLRRESNLFSATANYLLVAKDFA